MRQQSQVKKFKDKKAANVHSRNPFDSDYGLTGVVVVGGP